MYFEKFSEDLSKVWLLIQFFMAWQSQNFSLKNVLPIFSNF